ncbi:MAG: shikimate dehydrogenase family protein [Candidatus Cyclobacteriaceae bacterium M3_2C_046]
MRLFGLIGYSLSHSFSEKYFTEKFEKEQITDCQYRLFELKQIRELEDLLVKYPNLEGFNVTIPYKNDVMAYLDDLDESALLVGAVNVVQRSEKKLIGYNSDYYGFKLSLDQWLPDVPQKALVLGTGGAAKAVKAALQSLNIPFLSVSRDEQKGDLSYAQLSQSASLLKEYTLIINTTPLGMSPHVQQFPAIPYDNLNQQHFLYDLIYNPAETMFLKKGKAHQANIKNGLEMLEVQAEKSWEIWNS